jgi:hypothetical protein
VFGIVVGLATLISIPKESREKYVDPILNQIKTIWTKKAPQQGAGQAETKPAGGQVKQNTAPSPPAQTGTPQHQEKKEPALKSDRNGGKPVSLQFKKQRHFLTLPRNKVMLARTQLQTRRQIARQFRM